ncbi:MAG TPA: carbamate kinase [Chloroflexota bacterium]|nr:carbamate kinase [Chloroflexota bacterium]
MPLAVVAFGGNAILQPGQRGTVAEQAANLAAMAEALAALLAAGWQVVVIHGNGPQVGNLVLQQEAAAPDVPPQPLDVCGAMSQGQLGYLLAQALDAAFAARGWPYTAVGLLTRCVVDPADLAFATPSKPIGPFYDPATAAYLRAERGWTLVQDAGRGWRRVVPSPRPLRLVERAALRQLLAPGLVVLCCGGGGVPVVERPDGRLEGVEAVIDKDLAASLVARELAADALLLLTAVPEVRLHFGTPQERPLRDVPLAELEAYARAGHFAAGSMGPKVEAACEFVRAGGAQALITAPAHVLAALQGRAGTRVRREL